MNVTENTKLHSGKIVNINCLNGNAKWWRCGGWSGLGLLGPALVLRPPPDADHVVAGDGHHVLVVVATSDLQFNIQTILI